MRTENTFVFILAVAGLALMGHIVEAQTNDGEKDPTENDVNLIGSTYSPVEAAEGIRAVEAYVYGKPPSANSIRIFDRKTEKLVELTLGSIGTTGIRTLAEKKGLAIPADFYSNKGVPYTLVFAISESPDRQHLLTFGREITTEALDTLRVQDVIIFSANGTPRLEWVSGTDGWTLKKR